MQPAHRSSLSPQAAILRGGHYQHAIGWMWVCRMLHGPDRIASVSFEDRDSGAFDDVVVRRHREPHLYIQAKSSNFGGKPVNSEWLLEGKTTTRSSPLQRFYSTFQQLAQAGERFDLELDTNRAFDPRDPLLGPLQDRKHGRIDTRQMLAASPGSKPGKQRDLWADHLEIDTQQLAEFLASLRWGQTVSEADLVRQVQDCMAAAGLRNDKPAVSLGIAIVRDWITDGHGPIDAEAAGRRAAEMGLAPLPEGGPADKPVLSCLPPSCWTPIEDLRATAPETAQQVERLLSDRSALTPGVLAAIIDNPPEWLEGAGHLAFEATAEFLAAHGLPGVGAARRAAIHRGSPDSDLWRILEAVRAARAGYNDRAEALTGQTSPQHLLFDAAQALIAGDARAAVDAIETSRACDAQKPAVSLNAHTLLAEALVGCGDSTTALRTLEAACGRFPDHGGLFLSRAKLLIGQADRHPYGSDRGRGLLESAVDLALRARDSRRHWGGPSAAAVVVAADALVRLDDLQRVDEITAAAPQGEARPREAEAVDVVRVRAIALLGLDRVQELQELDLEIFDDSEGAYLAALRAKARSDHNAVELMREAVAQARDDNELRRALAGLALFGETDETALTRLDIPEADRALVQATACFYRQDYQDAIEVLEPHHHASVAHAELFANATQAIGDTEGAVEFLLQSARRQPSARLYGTAAEMLMAQQDFDRAEEVLLDALARPSSRRQQRQLMGRLLETARQRRDWDKAESYGRRLLAAFPDETAAVWAIVEACIRRGDGPAAWETVMTHDLRPHDEATARLAVNAYGLAGPAAPGTSKLLDIVDSFAHNDEIAGAALAAVMLKPGDTAMTATDQERFARALDAHCERFEESQTLRRFSGASIEDLAEQLGSLVKAPSEEEARFVGLVRSGLAPYGALCAVGPSTYAELLVSMAAGTLTAVSLDDEERNRERHAARDALNGIVAADTSVVAFALHAGTDPQNYATEFKRVLIADELVADANHAAAGSHKPVVGKVFQDPAAGQLIPVSTQEDHKQLREQLERLVDVLGRWHEVPSGPVSGHWDNETGRRFRPWDAALRVAADNGCALWCDDIFLRRWAHSEGIPAFGTYALAEEIASRQPPGQPAGQDDLKASLLAAGVADVPLTWDELTAIADNDSTAQAAQRFLERPSSWHQPAATLRWYFDRANAAATEGAADQVVGLLQAATIGAGTTAEPAARRRLLGDLLASAILNSSGFSLSVAPHLVLASRRGCWAVDPSGELDVLSDTTETLLHAYLTEMEPAAAAAAVLKLFSTCQQTDRDAVTSAVLMASHGQRRASLPTSDSP